MIGNRIGLWGKIPAHGDFVITRQVLQFGEPLTNGYKKDCIMRNKILRMMIRIWIQVDMPFYSALLILILRYWGFYILAGIK